MAVTVKMEGSDGGDLSPQHHQPPTHSYKPSKFLSAWTFTDQATLASLLERERDYGAWQRKDVTEAMRSEVVDWMMDVTADFCMKRDTFHGAVWILDRVLSSPFPVSKAVFQLVGLVAIMLSAKLEETTIPSIEDYRGAVEHGYSAGQIRRMEREVLRQLRWKIAPSALSVWVNWTLVQWDKFVVESFDGKWEEMPLFKVPQKDSYANFRYCFELADSLLLKWTHSRYSKPQLCSALLYLSLAHSLCFDSLCAGAARKDREVLAAWQRFVSAVFGDTGALEQVVEYVWQEGRVRKPQELPKICRIVQPSVLEQHFEAFLCYQTYSV